MLIIDWESSEFEKNFEYQVHSITQVEELKEKVAENLDFRLPGLISFRIGIRESL